MEYNKYIPDIYHVQSNIYDIKYDIYNLKKKYIKKIYKIKPYESINISDILENFANYIYIETESNELYFEHMNSLIKIYNKMIKNIFLYEFISNKSNDYVDIIIFIILKEYWPHLYSFLPLLLTNDKNIILYKKDKFNKNVCCRFYDKIYIETITEIKNNIIEINTLSNDITFYYYAFKICRNFYELRIKKIFSEKYNFNININVNIDVNIIINLDKYYNILKKIMIYFNKLKIDNIEVNIDNTQIINIINIIPTIYLL